MNLRILLLFSFCLLYSQAHAYSPSGPSEESYDAYIAGKAKEADGQYDTAMKLYLEAATDPKNLAAQGCVRRLRIEQLRDEVEGQPVTIQGLLMKDRKGENGNATGWVVMFNQPVTLIDGTGVKKIQVSGKDLSPDMAKNVFCIAGHLHWQRGFEPSYRLIVVADEVKKAEAKVDTDEAVPPPPEVILEGDVAHRKLRHQSLPDFAKWMKRSGRNRADVSFSITIMPDGSIKPGTLLLVMSSGAVDWDSLLTVTFEGSDFEPLDPAEPQVEQSGYITFKFVDIAPWPTPTERVVDIDADMKEKN